MDTNVTNDLKNNINKKNSINFYCCCICFCKYIVKYIFIFIIISIVYIIYRYSLATYGSPFINSNHLININSYSLTNEVNNSNVLTPDEFYLKQLTFEKNKIPKIIHQLWKGNASTIPQHWEIERIKCLKENSNYIYVLWTDDDMENYMKKFENDIAYKNYMSYRYVIQKVDAFRYYILYKFGGVYIDLDIGCRKCLNSLIDYANTLEVKVMFPETRPIGVSNDVIIAAPGHAFFKNLIDNLPRYNYFYLLKFPTVFFTTGPAFVSLNLAYYKEIAPEDSSSIFIIPIKLYASPFAYFEHVKGSSWHDDTTIFLNWFFYESTKYIQVNMNFIIKILIIVIIVIIVLVILCKYRSFLKSLLILCMNKCKKNNTDN